MRTDSSDVNLDRCYGCSLHDSTDPIFDLCKHESSRYSIGGKVDFHTIGHMRTHGACGNGAVLFKAIEATPAKRRA